MWLLIQFVAINGIPISTVGTVKRSEIEEFLENQKSYNELLLRKENKE